MAFACRDSFVACVEVHDQYLIHTSNVFADLFRKIVSEYPLDGSPVTLAKSCCASTKANKHLMVMPMTRTKRAGRVPHDRIFAGEVIEHKLLQPSGLEREFNRYAF